MAMSVMYNAGAQLSLGQLNKNISRAGKALAKVSSGMKINSAQDDASAYAISERMRVQIRALDQDHQNVQNGSSMVRVAERGIDQIIQNIRTLKEKAIDAANDSNTDEDRATIQKEFNQLVSTIDDIAIGTQYNGKILLDGRYEKPVVVNPVTDMVDAFKAADNATEQTGTHYSRSTDATAEDPDNWIFKVDKSFTKTDSDDFSVELDFSSMDSEAAYPDSLHNQGFSILCGGCEQYINVVFDANKTASQSTYNRNASSSNPKAREFVIGIKNVKSPDNLAETIFEGVSAVSNQITPVYGFTNTNNDLLLDSSHTLRIRRDPNDPSKILFTKTKSGPAMQFRNGIIPDPSRPELDDLLKRKSGPLWIQHGTQANQRINVYINSMQTKDLKGKIPNEADAAQLEAWSGSPEKQAELQMLLDKAKDMTLNDARVTTVDNAKVAIRVVEGALEYALDQATNMGAYLQRLEATDTNVTTMSENVQAAESTIRDADMAKEMSEYTRYNILTQSAQAMLAQANQNSSSVLSLLG